MLEFLYASSWGAFATMLCFQLPVVAVFLLVVHRKAVIDRGPGRTAQKTLSRGERLWMALVLVVFVGINLASIEYMPTFAAARAASAEDLQEVDVTARSWSYDISRRELEAGRPVRFSARSADTMHGFAVYHPDGRMLFTMMLIPGMKTASSIVHTFDQPGRYKVRCLEYCGIAHHLMRDELIVTASQE